MKTTPWLTINGWYILPHEVTKNALDDVPEWLADEHDALRATNEVLEMLAHGRIVGAHHVDRLTSEEDAVWPRLYLAIGNQERRDVERQKVAARVKARSLRRRPCVVCGLRRVDAHHVDYDAPLDVRWLCKTHHVLVHQGYTIEELQALEQVAA